jgi:hypothetical protein
MLEDSVELDEVKRFVTGKYGEALLDPRCIGEKLHDVGQFLIANYEQMPADAQAYADEFFKKFADMMATLLPKMPDGKERRAYARQVAQVQRRHFQARQLARHLIDLPVGDAPIITESEVILYGVLQSILDVLFDATRESSQGIPTLPLLALHYWCIDELLSAYHLSRHHFSTQAYAHIRLTYEHLDLITLFRQQPQWVEVWAGGDTKRIIRELSPKGIREKLGKKAYDPIYSAFTEMGAHGSFAGMQARTGMRGRSPDGTTGIVAWVGGVPRQEQIVFSILWTLMTSVSVLGSSVASFEERLHADEALDMLRTATKSVTKWHKQYFVPWAKANGFDVDGLISLLEKAPEIFRFYKES